MNFRQVHLDFHTSGLIPEIGGRFSKKQFQEALLAGHVNSITVFSKCHHGWAYHPSKANTTHPQLHFDLLGEELEACREIGVRAPVYLSAGLDEKEVLEHPEWLNVSPDGTETSPFTQAHYHLMCYNTPYLEKLALQVEEVMERYNPCGIFLDISNVRMCVCASCVKSMLEKGMDPSDPEDIRRHGEMVYFNYTRRIERAVRKYSATATIFHNAGHIAHGRRDIAHEDTHLELESLPTGGWGYDHFPMSAAYVRTLDMEFLGMTGKFHTTWGEFGGFKHPNALIYETSLSLACGAAISIGDQLHPSGEMNMSTYRLIGAAYAQVEKKEPYCIGARNLADIGIVSGEAFFHGTSRDGIGTENNTGASRILLEGKHLFDILDQEADFSRYKLLILPDIIRLDDALTARLQKYLAEGGKLLLTGQSGLKSDSDAFALDVGAVYAGKNPVRPDYCIPGFPCTNGDTAYVMYAQGSLLKDVTGEVFAQRQASYFNRAYNHFSSHQHTPNDVQAPLLPASVRKGSIAYIGWEVFADYAQKGELFVKELVLYAIDLLLGKERAVETTLPDRGIVTLTKQGNRYVNHLLFAYTSLRGRLGSGKNIEVIEGAVPLYDTEVSVRLEKAPSKVYLAPEGEALPFRWDGERVHYTVPKFTLHQMVAIEME